MLGPRDRSAVEDQSPPYPAGRLRWRHLGLHRRLHEGPNAGQLVVQALAGFLFLLRQRERGADSVRRAATRICGAWWRLGSGRVVLLASLLPSSCGSQAEPSAWLSGASSPWQRSARGNRDSDRGESPTCARGHRTSRASESGVRRFARTSSSAGGAHLRSRSAPLRIQPEVKCFATRTKY